MALTTEPDLIPEHAGLAAPPPVDVRLVAFRYHPAIGGAEQHARRLLQEIGGRLSIDVVTLLSENRSDWLRSLIDGARDDEARYEVDGRLVRGLARWSLPTRRRLQLLSPLYHVPRSPAPTLMGRLLATELGAVVDHARLIHNVFMGREAFSLGLMIAAHRAGLPFLFTPLRHQRPLGWNSPAFQQLYREADRLVALTNSEAAWLVRQGARADRVRVIGIGPLSDPQASNEPARAIIGNRKLVLFIGQLHHYKGYRQLLQAARSMTDRKDVVFVFAGPDVRNHARAFQQAAENVRYLGPVSDAMRNALLNQCTVLCVPSSRESFGGAIVDAWACGKPVVGGPAEAVRELIDEGVDGWTVEQQPTAIAERITGLIDNPELGRRAGEAGREKVHRRFSWASIAESYLQLYAELGVVAGHRGG